MNKKISFPIAIIIIIVCAVLTGIIAWQYRIIPEIEIPPLTPSEKPPKDETAEWKTYRNEEYGFEIKFPSGWEVGEDYSGRIYFENQGEIVIIITPISEETFEAMGVGYCTAYPEDESRCEDIIINDKTYNIDKFSDSESVLIASPYGGALFIILQSITNELQTIFRKMLSTFRFLE